MPVPAPVTQAIFPVSRVMPFSPTFAVNILVGWPR
jgi:hypothetical protein